MDRDTLHGRSRLRVASEKATGDKLLSPLEIPRRNWSNLVAGILITAVFGFFIAAFFLSFLKQENSTEVANKYESDTVRITAPSSKVLVSENKMSLTALRHEIVKQGSGNGTIQRGQDVTVHAIGSVIKSDGSLQKFWSTRDSGQRPFTWKAGIGQVISGWDQGVLGMKLGEIRKIFIPFAMGYGPNGFPAWGIPPNADLHFEIECLSMN